MYKSESMAFVFVVALVELQRQLDDDESMEI